MGDSKQSPLSSTEVAYQWILKFAAITGKPADRVQQDIWAEALRDIPADRLNAACKRLMENWRLPNLPLPGDVRAQLEGADEKAFDLEAEREWQRLLAWIRENYFPDVGVRRGAPRLDPAIEHASRAAGGYHFIERCSEEELVWCRKTFLTAYRNVHETGQVQHLLGDREAKRIVTQLSTATNVSDFQRHLAPGPNIQKPTPEEKGVPREEVREVLTRVYTPPTPTEDEIRQRRESMHHVLKVKNGYKEENLEEYLAKHGLAKPPSFVTTIPVAGAKDLPQDAASKPPSEAAIGDDSDEPYNWIG
jgi:hypothetical protein